MAMKNGQSLNKRDDIDIREAYVNFKQNNANIEFYALSVIARSRAFVFKVEI